MFVIFIEKYPNSINKRGIEELKINTEYQIADCRSNLFTDGLEEMKCNLLANLTCFYCLEKPLCSNNELNIKLHDYFVLSTSAFGLFTSDGKSDIIKRGAKFIRIVTFGFHLHTANVGAVYCEINCQ